MLGATRILVGALFACHGAQKLLVVFGGLPEGTSAAIVASAGGIELLGGALMAAGLFLRVPRRSGSAG